MDEPFTLVGEHGPEVVSLPRGSYVHTARQTQGMLGGQATDNAPLVGEVHVHTEADENRLLGKLDAWLARAIQKQQQGAA